MAITFAMASLSAWGADDGKLPELRPARDEIAESFWERNGLWVVLGAFGLLAILTLLFNTLRRPRAHAVTPPPLAARRALEALRGRADDASLAVEVSHIFRHYLYFALELPHDELTTTELCGKLRVSWLARSEEAGAIEAFLRKCDEAKFATAPGAGVAPTESGTAPEAAGPAGAPKAASQVEVAFDLLNRVETYRRQRVEAAQRGGGADVSPAAA